METQHIREVGGRMGQAGEVDCQQQAIFTQRPLVNTGTSSVRRLQSKRLRRDV